MNKLPVQRVIGADIGGANLKYASDAGAAHSRPFAMWQHPDRLADAIVADLAVFSPAETLAVTMTGELADCFVDRNVGVEHIVRATSQTAAASGIRQILFYGLDGGFHSAEDAIKDPDLVAAANWHALASFVARRYSGDGVLIDVGSTTTDVIPIGGGTVATDAQTDYQRLREGSLVYVGCRRTPVCALVDQLEIDGRPVPVMNECFATIDDARLLLAQQQECPEDLDTADGRPRTREFAANRLARMVGLDRRAMSVPQASLLASQVYDAARQRIGAAVNVALSRGASLVILSGHGHDLVKLPPGAGVEDFTNQLGPQVSRCAPAFAVAQLSASVLQVQRSI